MALLLLTPFCASAQTANSIPDARDVREELIHAFESESKLGTHIFYTQIYKSRGRRVEFRGSLLGQVQDLQLDRCEMKFKSRLVDLYTGTIGDGPVGRTQSEYISSIQFKLTIKMAAELEVVTARPVRQLPIGTNAVCSGDQNCMLTWIKVNNDARVIHLTEFTNDTLDYDGDVKDFNGTVKQFWLPVSSMEAGLTLVRKMQAFAQVCSN